MAGNISEEKLYYQDYNNVILVDPNKVFNADGVPVDRLVQFVCISDTSIITK